MKTVKSIPENLCSGCMMCSDICPVKAISFSFHDDGFWYPEIDSSLCTECGLCRKKCPAANDDKAGGSAENVFCFGAKSKDENTREHSTSGGFFSELALAFTGEGGVCCAAQYDDRCEVVHSFETNPAGIDRQRQSKYSQSNIQGAYKKTKELIENGKNVLFCGAPCQVEALISFLGGQNDRLLTMDFVCCGICSPVVYKKYLGELEQKYRSKARSVWFKNKRLGWRSIATRISFENGREYFRPGSRDLYMRAFVTDGISMRSSCHSCKYRKVPHASDITVADFWGVEKIKPEADDNKGLSAVIINTEQGKMWFEKLKSKLNYFETDINEIAAGNFTVFENKAPGKYRKQFLEDIQSGKLTFKKAMRKYGSYSGTTRLRADVDYYKSKLKSRLKKHFRKG